MARTTTIRKNRRKKEKSLWIGLIEVTPKAGNGSLGNAKGAYVNVVTFATSALSFKKRVIGALSEMNMNLVEFDPPEQLRARLFAKRVDKEIIQMAETARKLDSVVFGTFHTYISEGES
jgi:hypothetical protein